MGETLHGTRGSYAIDGSMGRGTKFGGVMTATDDAGGRVTVKALERHGDGLRSVLQRLMTIKRPDVAEVRDVFTADDGRLYVVRSMIAGSDLKTVFANKKVYGKIDEDQFLKMGCAVLCALEAVHAAGVIHRDIKPSNIIIRHEAEADLTKCDMSHVALIDFEQGQLFPPDGSARSQFSLIYSPPEMLLKHNELVGPQADIFALATTIYHMVMGKTPYTDCNPEVLINLQLTYPMKKPARMTDELFGVLSKAAHKASFRLPPRRLSPDEVEQTLKRGVEGRYATATEMLRDLEAVPHALKPATWWQRALGDK